MPDRDSQSFVIGRQSLLLVTAVGIGLLTLAYVLGVQVGKQSAALRKPLAKGADEELAELPLPLPEQLKAFEKVEPKPTKPTETTPAETQKPEPAKPEATKADPPVEKEPAGSWTLQLVATSDAAEAERMAAKATAAGHPTVTVKDKGQLKVRLAKGGSREAMDAVAAKLKDKGLKPFALKIE